MEKGDKELRRTEDPLTEQIIGACIEVHQCLGPGLLEGVYEACVCQELTIRGITFRRQVPLPINYKGLLLDCSYRADVVVDESVVVELKAIEQLLPIHQAQVLTYLRLGNYRTGLLINFNVPSLRQGLRRLTHPRHFLTS